MKSRKQKPQFAARKAAFNRTIAAYRAAKDIAGGMGATNISDCGGGSPNPARPILADFRVDVESVIERVIPENLMLRFKLAYFEFDSENEIDREVYADKMLGSIRHGWEQGLGNQFLKHGLDKNYFYTIRQPRGSV